MTELAEALRSLDDTRKQKNDVSRELKELKYAGVGACPGCACTWEGSAHPLLRAGPGHLFLLSALFCQSVEWVQMLPPRAELIRNS